MLCYMLYLYYMLYYMPQYILGGLRRFRRPRAGHRGGGRRRLRLLRPAARRGRAQKSCLFVYLFDIRM